jgi:hypothetical protein
MSAHLRTGRGHSRACPVDHQTPDIYLILTQCVCHVDVGQLILRSCHKGMQYCVGL